MENDLKKGVLVGKTITQFRADKSAPLFTLWRHVIVLTLLSCTSSRRKV